MSTGAEQKNRNLEVVPGALYGRRRPRGRGPAVVPADVLAEYLALDRAMRTAFVCATGMCDEALSEGLYDVRRGAQFPWRVLARRLVEMRDVGIPLTTAQRPLRVLLEWQMTLYGERPKLAA